MFEPMGRKSIKHIRQREIVEAFYEAACQEGLENASISKVAGLMNIHPSLIIHYFNTRDTLIFALIEYNLERYKLMFEVEGNYSSINNRIKAMMDHLFSRQWNLLFDDGVFYSCYALIFRHEKIKTRYKQMHDSLRQLLAATLEKGIEEDVLDRVDTQKTADRIFVIVEGAYYYLSLVGEQQEYEEKLEEYKTLALSLIKFKQQTSFAGQ